MKKRKEYAIYRGEELLHIGTKGQLANILNVSVSTINFYATPFYRRIAESGNMNKRLIAVAIDEDE